MPRTSRRDESQDTLASETRCLWKPGEPSADPSRRATRLAGLNLPRRAIAGLPEHLRGAKVEGVPHTPWRLLEPMRIAQSDILEFSRNAEHVSPEFPDETTVVRTDGIGYPRSCKPVRHP
jgi:hypothetical protein